MDPITAIGATALIGGTGLQAWSQKKAGEEENEIRKRDAAIIEAESEREARAAGEQAGLTRAEKARLAARQNVLYAKGGVMGGQGTPLIVREDSLKRIEQQAQVIQERGLFARETGQSRAALERYTGEAAKRAGRLQAGASLLTGFGQAFLLGGPYGSKTPKNYGRTAGPGINRAYP
jgi:hypothetical protein